MTSAKNGQKPEPTHQPSPADCERWQLSAIVWRRSITRAGRKKLGADIALTDFAVPPEPRETHRLTQSPTWNEAKLRKSSATRRLGVAATLNLTFCQIKLPKPRATKQMDRHQLPCIFSESLESRGWGKVYRLAVPVAAGSRQAAFCVREGWRQSSVEAAFEFPVWAEGQALSKFLHDNEKYVPLVMRCRSHQLVRAMPSYRACQRACAPVHVGVRLRSVGVALGITTKKALPCPSAPVNALLAGFVEKAIALQAPPHRSRDFTTPAD